MWMSYKQAEREFQDNRARTTPERIAADKKANRARVTANRIAYKNEMAIRAAARRAREALEDEGGIEG